MRRLYLIACAVCFLAPSLASAAIINLSASMDGAQANAGAGTGSAATGSAVMTLEDVTGEFTWTVQWEGLTATNAHFHGPALPDQNAGVQVPIDWTVNPTAGITILSAQQQADLLAGLWYVNIHTAAFPVGEIRGQVNVVPIPAAAWLFGSTLLGLGLIKRKNA
jgi:hypothetical protein